MVYVDCARVFVFFTEGIGMLFFFCRVLGAIQKHVVHAIVAHMNDIDHRFCYAMRLHHACWGEFIAHACWLLACKLNSLNIHGQGNSCACRCVGRNDEH